MVPGVAGADGDKLQHAGVAVAVNHATRAAVANQLRRIELVNVAHGRFPEMTAIEVQVPVEIEIFMPAQAAKFLWLLAEMPLHFGERLGGINHRIAALA